MQNTFNPFSNMSFKNPFMDRDDMMSSHKKNLETLSDAAKMAAEVTKSVAQLQGQFMKQFFSDMQSWGKSMEDFLMKDMKMDKQADRMKETFNHGLDHSMKLANMVRQGQKDIYDVFKSRMEENFSDFQNRSRQAASSSSDMSHKKPKN